MRSVLMAAILLGIVAAGLTPLHAAGPQCGLREKILAELANRYGEAPIAIGLANSGILVEIIGEETGKTWTIIATRPDGVSCLLATGEDWQQLRDLAKGNGT